MLVDTHCHIQSIIKKTYTMPLETIDLINARTVIQEAQKAGVSPIINVGSSAVDNDDCIMLSQQFDSLFIAVGLHPNDCTENWKHDFQKIKQWMQKKEEFKIVGIGECGIDKHYPNYTMQRQRDAFKAQIELALEQNLALIVHSRDAYEETLRIIEEYKNDISRAVMHCFSYDRSFANTIIAWNFMLGIGGTVTYPKNDELRAVIQEIDLKYIVLETDAPFLPPQNMRGKKNHPQYIKIIAEYIAHLRQEPFEKIAEQTTKNAYALFSLPQNNYTEL